MEMVEDVIQFQTEAICMIFVGSSGLALDLSRLWMTSLALTFRPCIGNNMFILQSNL